MRRSATVAGHFGEWLQGRLGPEGPVALVTLPCAVMGVAVRVRPGPVGAPLRLRGAGMGAEAAVAFLATLGLTLGGRVRMRPLAPPGLGTGVSTARLVALARLAGWRGPVGALAVACVRWEGASDPLMFAAPERMLWASREGRVLGALPALPPYEILGGFRGPPCRTDHADAGFSDIADLVEGWARARDLAGFAELASESAARCLALRGPAGDPVAGLAADLGALGWITAHTGAARGLIFAPGTIPPRAPAVLRAAGLRGILRFAGGGGE